MQQDLEAFLETSKTKRPHPGRNMKARPPLQSFLGGLKGLKPGPKRQKLKERPKHIQ